MDSIRIALTQIKAWLDWLPAPLIALVVHDTARKLRRRALINQQPYVLSVLTQMRGLTQLGLLIL